MRNKKALQIALLKILMEHRRLNNQTGLPRKRTGPVKLSERGAETPAERVVNYNALIPRHMAGVKLGKLDFVRAAYAIGMIKGIALTNNYYRQQTPKSLR